MSDNANKNWEAYAKLSLPEKLEQAVEIRKLASEFANAYTRLTTYEMFCQIWNQSYPHLPAPLKEDYARLVGAILTTFAVGQIIELAVVEQKVKEKECATRLKEPEPKKPPSVIYL